jgi:hypothetical protein
MSTGDAPLRAASEWGTRVLFETLAVFVLAMSGFGLLFARMGIFDAPPVWLLSLIATGGYFQAVRTWQRSEYSVPGWHLLLLLGVGLLFRLTPDAYVLGGQDQGVYLNTAMHLANVGNLVPVDPVLPHLSDPAAREIYRNSNYLPTSYLPGIYSTPGGLVFQFYHLFPVWLALFGDGSGPATAVYALTFLSLVSILFFYRLAYLLTADRTAALAAGLLLALNPLHAFFSRFPVTEVPALAFSLIGFSFLLDYWRNAGNAGKAGSWRFLLISALAMCCLFFTRISGFMYMPVVVAITLAAMCDERRDRRLSMLAWGIAVIAGYAASVCYGLIWSRPYASDIYRLSFGPGLGRHVLLVLGVGTAAAAVVWWAAQRAASQPARRLKLVRMLHLGVGLLPFIAVTVALVAAWKAFALGYTDAYATDPVIAARFGLAQRGWVSIFSTSLVATAVYLSPFLFAAFFPAAFAAGRSALMALVLLCATYFFAIVVLFQPVLPYQPYYARYLLSEVVPYLLLLVVCVWAALEKKSRARAWLAAALCAGGLYCGLLSSAQIGKSEHEGVSDSLARLLQDFDRGDLVLIDVAMTTPQVSELKTPLVFTAGLNVASATRADLARPHYLDRLDRDFDDVFLLSTDCNAPFAGFRRVDSTRYLERIFTHGAIPPTTTAVRGESTICTYRYDPVAMGGEVAYEFAGGGSGTGLLGAGWSTPEQWGVWSNGTAAQVSLPLHVEKAGQYVVEIEGRAYVTPKVPAQSIIVTDDAGSSASTIARFPDGRVHLRLQVDAAPGRSNPVLHFVFQNAVSPLALGYSKDGRTLAFGLEEIRVAPPATGPVDPAGAPH